jgi:O-glycosyl hydrolase
MNEPASGYWKAGSSKQEVCGFQTANQQNIMLAAARKALDAQGLEDVGLTASDETDVGQGIISYKWLNDANKAALDLISVHTYHATDEQRAQLRDLARSDGKKLWMTEAGFGGGAHSETAMGGMELSSGIMADLKVMGVTGWCAWILADSEYEALQNNHNWGLLHAVFEDGGQPVAGYHTNLLTGDGKRKAGIPASGFHTTKQFYTMMQYSKFIKTGYTIIETGDSPVLAAVPPDGAELVIVAHSAGAAHALNVDISAFGAASAVRAYETSASRSCEEVNTAALANGVLTCTLPAESVTTFVVKF